jgi:HEXXH motif-containing protein
MSVTAHRISDDAFDALARGRADADTVRTLMAGQRSRHLLVLREVVLAARKHPAASHAAGLQRAVAALDEVQRRAPDAAAQVLGYPLVGAWAAHCLRRLRSKDPEHGGVPLWVDLAHLNAVAASATMAAGRSIDVRLPMRSGTVHLPTLGRASLVSHAGFGEVRLSGDAAGYTLEGLHGTVHLPQMTSAASATWTPLVRWTLSGLGRQVEVVIDHLDPYRDCHGLTSAADFSADQERTWHGLLRDAWDLLCRHHPERAEELSAGPIVLVPLEPAAGGPGMNATARDSTGAIAMSPPLDVVDLAQSLVHEFQHSKLGALLDLVNLYDLEDRRLFYSPWRADPRPLGGLLQAAYAFLAVADFWRRQLDAGAAANVPLCIYKLARSREQLVTTVCTLQECGSLAPDGRRFVEELREEVDRVHRVPFPSQALVRSAVVNLHHLVSWRLRNVSVPEADISVLATAYVAGERAPAAATPGCLLTGIPRYDEEPLDELARREVADTLTRTRTRRNLEGPHEGDLALLSRDYVRAGAVFQEQVTADPEDLAAWAGLVVARQYEPGLGARGYLQAPEVVAHLYRHLRRRLGTRAPQPDDLACWLV